MFITTDFRLTRRIPFNLICAVLIFFAASQAARADELAIWNFNDSNLIVDRGQGTLTTTANPANIIFLTGTTMNASMGDPAGMALAIQGGANLQNNGSILELRVSTVGFTNITIAWVVQRSDTGFNDVVNRWWSDV